MVQIFAEKGENKIKSRKDYRKVRINKKIVRVTKVLVLDSSPKMEIGNTYLILNPFIEGMRDSGADVEVIQLHKLEIGECTGDFHCWEMNPGECDINDDMQILYSKIKNADIIVLSSPLYWRNINSKMKSVIDRMIPLLTPLVVTDNGRSRNVLRKGVKRARLALISTCGHWEIESFDYMVDYIKEFCRDMSYEYCGAILRPHADAIQPMLAFGKDIDQIFEAARMVGEEFIKDECINGSLTEIISEELMPREEYTKEMENYFDEDIIYFK